ncbi:hypothetical protein E2P71_06005 [Candidatus Bathyarchaeota archaeon]|nr:hypothetical protein E2P71_06005 [Candidatus Bathyarchaeota archaeon]
MRFIRKAITALLIIIVIGSVAGSIYVHNLSGVWIHDVILSRPLSQEQIEKSKGELVRVYPDKLFGTWEPNGQFAAVMLRKDAGRLHEIGVNTISVVAYYDFNPDGTITVKDQQYLYSNIIRAKQNGFAVYFSINFLGAASQTLEQMGVDWTLDDFFTKATEEAIYWAGVCEEYNVEYYNVHNEMNCFIFMNYPNQLENTTQVAQLIAEWHQQILPEITQRYMGRIVAKFCAPEFDKIAQTASMYEGYDIIGFTHQHFYKNLEDFREFTRSQFSVAEEMAFQIGAQWMVGEAWFSYGPRWGTVNDAGESLDELQDDYYRITLEELSGYTGNKPAGIIFHSWNMPTTSVKDRPAQNILQEYFTNNSW